MRKVQLIGEMSKPGEIFLIQVEPGTFLMGSPENEPGRFDEEKQHEVMLTYDYWLGKYPVTQGQWQALMGNNPSFFKGECLPVMNVSWDDAMSFCRMLTERERKAGRLLEGYVYRLPTEAEWEFAARGGAQSCGFLYSGSNDLNEVGLYAGNSGGRIYPVGQKKPNELGFHDMSGNVYEWCYDWYGDYPDGLVTNPRGPVTGSNRVYRGGSWFIVARGCRVAFRFNDCSPSFTYYDLGFRLALAPAIEFLGKKL